MDSMITAAARALAAGDPLGALNRIALREDGAGLALRGLAMAQLGDLAKARELLRRAARRFGAREPMARARCVVAEAEIALVSRDLAWPEKELAAALEILEQRGDRMNAAHARYLECRRLLLLGRLDQAERVLVDLDPDALAPASKASHELVVAGVALRRIKTAPARAALTRAEAAARQAGIPALLAEVERAAQMLSRPAARRIGKGQESLLRLEEVETLFASASDALVIDACRLAARRGEAIVSLATRPVLFALARALAEAWPGDASRETLLTRAFGAKQADESHRARLRVEIGRLRAELAGLAELSATKAGFALNPRNSADVVVLAPPVEDAHAPVLALLADGEAWSSSALALALGTSQRTVQRSLDALAAQGKAESAGQGRARRWMAASAPGFPTVMLLPGSAAGG